MSEPLPSPTARAVPDWRLVLSAPVIVAALGYFVDIYDLILFSVVRVPSLTALGLDADGAKKVGLHLLDLQMYGMLAGGVLWGVLGDRRGRMAILFGSIILYSLANLLNAGVGLSATVDGILSPIRQYEILRLVAGIGLAGELGAGITLVAEALPVRLRGLGTMVVAAVGVAGATLAYTVADHADWRIAYAVGGVMGFALLGLRWFAHESRMFTAMDHGRETVAAGNFLALFTSWDRLGRYLLCIGIGVPTWFVVAILVSLAPEMGRTLGVTAPVTGGGAIFWCYLGLVVGDFASGALSQLLRSRRKAIAAFLLLSGMVWGVYLTRYGDTPRTFYAICFAVGIGVGYWALFVTVAAEQFGTNLRATAATTVPNMVRGLVPLFTALYRHLEGPLGALGGAALIGAGALAIALFSVWAMRETFASDLDYAE
jgi:MFS family permease